MPMGAPPRFAQTASDENMARTNDEDTSSVNFLKISRMINFIL